MSAHKVILYQDWDAGNGQILIKEITVPFVPFEGLRLDIDLDNGELDTLTITSVNFRLRTGQILCDCKSDLWGALWDAPEEEFDKVYEGYCKLGFKAACGLSVRGWPCSAWDGVCSPKDDGSYFPGEGPKKKGKKP